MRETKNPASATGAPHLIHNPSDLLQAQHQPRTPPGTSFDTRQMPKSGVRGRGPSHSPGVVPADESFKPGEVHSVEHREKKGGKKHCSLIRALLGTTSSWGSLSSDGGVLLPAHTPPSARSQKDREAGEAPSGSPQLTRTSPFTAPAWRKRTADPSTGGEIDKVPLAAS